LCFVVELERGDVAELAHMLACLLRGSCEFRPCGCYVVVVVPS